MDAVDTPAALEVRISATVNADTFNLGTLTVTDDGDEGPQVARLLRAVADYLETSDPPRPQPDVPPSTRLES